VYIIGDQDENIFTYEYCSDLRGYLINGLNLRSAQNPEGVDFTTADNRLKYKDTLIFPATHNGLTVYGLTEDCFSDYEVVAIYGDNTTALPVHPFNDIKNFVLGINFVTIGEDAFNFEEYPVYRNIFSQVPSSQAKKMLGKACHCHDGNPEDISHNRYTGLHYDEEADYAYNSIVYYKEAWTFKSGTQTPVFTLAALNFVLDSDSYQYALGRKVEPKIVDVLVNDAFVKYPDGDETYTEYDEIHRTFYPVDDDELDLSSVSIQYSNNVNVGTGKMTIISACAGLTGSKEINFAITAMQIDAFYEAGKKANTYGTSNGMPEDADASNALRAQDHFTNIITNDGSIINPTWNNKVNFPNFREVVVLEPEYDGTAWTNSRWAVGDNIFGLPNGYHMSGVISTTSHEVGYYWVEEDVVQMFALGAEDALHPGEKINNISGFRWTTRPVITDSNGNDVTRNFKVAVTLAVYIKPFEITEVTWPGAKGDDGITYEYEYTGAPIVPVPTVVNANGKELNPRFTVEVTNGPALIPSAQIYEARVTSYDTRNFRYNVYSHGPLYDYNYIQFKVIPAKLHIRIEVANYLIGENELEFSFSDFKNWRNY
ncbi:MAG: hypothetical protein K2K15_03940, partial [Anaeroplasmataceae bacterium]|nr:hypothetical protein [Anaeroplasmataceae bacterium]